MKSPGKVAATDDPDVLVSAASVIFGVDFLNPSLNHADVGALNLWQLAVCETQAGCVYGHAEPVSSATLAAWRRIHS